MTNIWCVRAEFGRYTEDFVNGGYAAIDYGLDVDLAPITTREEIAAAYRQAHPDETSNIVVGQQVGQVARFVLEISVGRLHRHASCQYRAASIRRDSRRAIPI